jgi:hypothetical protein
VVSPRPEQGRKEGREGFPDGKCPFAIQVPLRHLHRVSHAIAARDQLSRPVVSSVVDFYRSQMLNNFVNFASCLQDLDLAFLLPACWHLRRLLLLGSPSEPSEPVLVPESINNLSICAYLFGLAQLEHNMTMTADLSSASARGIPGFESEYYDA